MRTPQEIGEIVRRERERLLIKQDESTVPSKAVWSQIENGRNVSYKQRSLSGVAAALRWPNDWWTRLEAGEDPSVLKANADDLADIRARLEVLEEQVRNLTTAAKPAQFGIAAEGARGRPPKDPGRRVSRPHPPAHDD